MPATLQDIEALIKDQRFQSISDPQDKARLVHDALSEALGDGYSSLLSLGQKPAGPGTTNPGRRRLSMLVSSSAFLLLLVVAIVGLQKIISGKFSPTH